MTAAIGQVAQFAFNQLTSGGLGSQLLGSVIGGGMNTMQQKMTAPTVAPTQMPEARGIMVNKNSNNESIPVLYGKRRVGGTRVYIESSDGSGNTAGTEYLNMVMVLAEGQCCRITKIFFDDELVFDGALTHEQTANSGNDVGGNRFENTFTVEFKDGRDDQTVSTLIQNSVGASNWSNNHRLRGVSYIAVKMQADAEKYEGAVPTITVELCGKQVADISTDPFSSYSPAEDINPVDAIYDYLTNTRYGRGIPAADIFLGDAGTPENYSFRKARQDLQNSGVIKFNGLVHTNETLFNNVQLMAEMANLYLIYSNGKYRLHYQTSGETASRTLTTDDILGGMKIGGNDKANRLNKATASFSDGAQNYHDDSLIVENTTYKTEDNAETLEANFEFSLITSKTAVTQMLNQKMDQSRNTRTLEVTVSHRFLNTDVGDIVGVTHEALGFTNKLFRVMKMEMSMDNSISLTLLEYDSTAHI